MNFQELKNDYIRYFKQVENDIIGGRNRIHHFTACMELVKEGKLKKVKNKFSEK